MEDSNQSPQSQEINSQMSSPPNNSSGSKLIPIILGIATVIVIAIGAYILGSNQTETPILYPVQPTPTSSPTPTIDLTANWKTYTNDKYGYSIKYPSSWGQLHDNNAIDPIKGEADSESPYITVYKKDSLEFDSNNAEGISIWVLPYTSKSFNESIERHKGNTIAYSKFIKESKQVINAIDMTLIETDVAGDDKIKPHNSRNYFFLTPDGRHYINIWVRDNSQQANKKSLI